MFHVELRQFPHHASAFNLSREQLHARILDPWLRERPVELDEQRFSPERARLTIYEGPALRPEELGLGRGWANATRSGQQVTDRLLSEARQALAERPNRSRADLEPSVRGLKQLVLDRCSATAVGIEEVLAMAHARFPNRRVSARVALAEQTVWELLHDGRVRLLAPGRPPAPIGSEDWEAVLLSWDTLATGTGPGVSLEGQEGD